MSAIYLNAISLAENTNFTAFSSTDLLLKHTLGT